MAAHEGCKVERVTERYDLHEADERLLRRRENEDASLRELETHLNRRLLKREMFEQGMSPLDGEVENYYRLLTDDTVMTTARREARRKLEEAGIDVDGVKADFVSYQTVRKHLNECLDKDTSEEYTPKPDNDRRNIEKIQQRLQKVVEKSVRRLTEHDVIQIGSPEATVSVKVTCGDCGRTYGITTLFRRRECPCVANESDAAASEQKATNLN
ncbi:MULTISPECIES: rod-determining factor RdfA [Natrialbaceae]|uniref:Uncharacterized protein n=2 Tax=Natrialbaceae TaxID=1644061 RepID=F8D6S6_HALXS|nr:MULTISPECIES: rod-determining factor RdfA [Natrialbaceae]AEH35623.1 hypothetical protein Halxa_0987 [Halopiger xanaduensis SH-6]QCW01866.1 hypothetical protein FGF80_00810 [Natrinema pallidum]